MLTGDQVVETGNLIGAPAGSVANVDNAKRFDTGNASNRGVSFRCSLLTGVLVTDVRGDTGEGIVLVFPIAFTPPKVVNDEPGELIDEVGGGAIEE